VAGVPARLVGDVTQWEKKPRGLYTRDSRFAGETKWNYWKLWNLAIEGIISFTIFPLKIASYIGLLTATWAFLYGLYTIYKTLRYGDSVHGYPSLMVVILFLGGVQLITLTELNQSTRHSRHLQSSL